MSTTQILTPSVSIADVAIRQDSEGRYCLNDLHKAAGGETRHKPSEWLRNKQAIELVEEVSKAGIPAIQSKQQLGTFVVRELVYAYAMWISPAFHLKVIRAYDSLVTAPPALNPANFSRLQLIELAMQAEQERLVLEAKVAIIEPKAQALDRISGGEGSQCITDAAKALKVNPKELFKSLESMKWIYRRAGGKNWLGYQDKIQAGFVEHKITTVALPDGTEKVREQALLTPKGITKLASILNVASGEVQQ